jgi:hypothetical protein
MAKKRDLQLEKREERYTMLSREIILLYCNGIAKTIKIALLKKKAKKWYLKYIVAKDELSCGISLAEHISPKLSYARNQFNKTMSLLSKLDPACPITRL